MFNRPPTHEINDRALKFPPFIIRVRHCFEPSPFFGPTFMRKTGSFEPSPFFGPTFMRKTGSFCIRAGMPALMQKRAPLGFGYQGSCVVGPHYSLSATPHI